MSFWESYPDICPVQEANLLSIPGLDAWYVQKAPVLRSDLYFDVLLQREMMEACLTGHEGKATSLWQWGSHQSSGSPSLVQSKPFRRSHHLAVLRSPQSESL